MEIVKASVSVEYPQSLEQAQADLARAVLPNSTKTELVMTANLREWIHFLSLRNAKPAHPQMREVASQIQQKLAELYPCIFGMETK